MLTAVKKDTSILYMSGREWGRSSRQLARQLDREATQRGLDAGARIAAEPVLIADFATSRGTLRQALGLLGFLGRVESRFGRGGGTVVAEPDHRVATSALAMVFQARAASTGDVLRTLAALQPTAASLAARRGDPGHEAAVTAALDALRLSVETASGVTYIAKVASWEISLATASGNAVLATVTSALVEMAVRLAFVADAPRAQRRRLVDEAEEIVAAVRTGDAESASMLAATSWERRLKQIQRQSADALAQPVVWADVDELLDEALIGQR